MVVPPNGRRRVVIGSIDGVRPYVALGVDVRSGLRATLRVDNPANTAELIRDNLSPPLGRQVMFGLTVNR